jgi:hypothetical protein
MAAMAAMAATTTMAAIAAMAAMAATAATAEHQQRCWLHEVVCFAHPIGGREKAVSLESIGEALPYVVRFE